MKFEVKYDSREIDVFLNNFHQKGLNKAVAYSLNDTRRTVLKETAQAFKKMLGEGIAIGVIRKALPLLRVARSTQPIEDQEEIIGADEGGISLSRFKPKQIATGVEFKVGGRTHRVKHAFIETMPNAGKNAVWARWSTRTGQKGRRYRKKEPNIRINSELPIYKLAYKSIHKMLPLQEKLIQKIIDERFNTRLEHNVKRFVTGL